VLIRVASRTELGSTPIKTLESYISENGKTMNDTARERSFIETKIMRHSQVTLSSTRLCMVNILTLLEMFLNRLRLLQARISK